MAAGPHSIDPTTYLDELLAQASPDLMRTNVRNGYRHRDLDTRVGSVGLVVPKLKTGSFFPDWLLERRTRAERSLTTVIATCYLKGVSTRRMKDLVATLGINNL